MTTDSEPPLNPYAAPQAELHQLPTLPQALDISPRSTDGNSGSIMSVWVIVFILNLPVATYLGLSLCRGLGALGVLAAIAGFMWLTLRGIRRSGRFAGCWIAGATCVALSQFLPYLHLMLGVMAVSMFQGPREQLHFSAALICSIIVGGGLIAVSLLLAGVFYLLFISWDER